MESPERRFSFEVFLFDGTFFRPQKLPERPWFRTSGWHNVCVFFECNNSRNILPTLFARRNRARPLRHVQPSDLPAGVPTASTNQQ